MFQPNRAGSIVTLTRHVAISNFLRSGAVAIPDLIKNLIVHDEPKPAGNLKPARDWSCPHCADVNQDMHARQGTPLVALIESGTEESWLEGGAAE